MSSKQTKKKEIVWRKVTDIKEKFDYPILIKLGRKIVLNVPPGWKEV